MTETSTLLAVNGTASTISKDEIALYDRQIRLWGMEAQNAIRNAKVLIVNMKALGNEIAKNLVLAGIDSLAISDLNDVSPFDLGAQFFITEEDVGKNRAEACLPQIQKLNPRVNCSVLQADPLNDQDTSYMAPFDVVVATDLPIESFNNINAACRVNNKRFYAAGSHGIYGFMFADLIQHTFSYERDPSNSVLKPGDSETPTRAIIDIQRVDTAEKKKELVTKREVYQPLILVNSSPLPADIRNSPRRMKAVPQLLPCLRALWDFEVLHGGTGPRLDQHQDLVDLTESVRVKTAELQLPFGFVKADFLRSFATNTYAELAPTSAFLGASLAQDVINVLGGKQQPCQNMVLFDGEEGKAEVMALVPLMTTA